MEFKQKQIKTGVEIGTPFYQDPNFQYNNLRGKKVYVYHSLKGTEPQTAGNYGVIWTAPFDCYIQEVNVSWQTAGSASSTLNVEKLTGTQALDAGVEVFSADLDTTTTANTVTRPTLNSTISNINLSRGDRLALKDGGTLTALVGLNVVITLIQS